MKPPKLRKTFFCPVNEIFLQINGPLPVRGSDFAAALISTVCGCRDLAN